MTKIDSYAAIQFLKGKDEEDHPEIRIFRNLDGKKGKAIYKFSMPSSITIENIHLIKTMYLIDEEGELSTRAIDLSISKNNEIAIKSTYNWNSEKEFARFMRFAERHSDSLNNYSV